MKTLENLSYWEFKQLATKRDLIVIGAGIVGLMSAYHYKLKHPSHSVLILERGILPEGASTKNAGFACFGSAGELLADLKTMSADTVWSTVQLRYEGLHLLRSILGDKAINYEGFGGFELFTNNTAFAEVHDQLDLLNKSMQETIGQSVYVVPQKIDFGFSKDITLIKNEAEGQIDTAAMMFSLLRKVATMDIELQFGAMVTDISSTQAEVKIESNLCTHTASNCIIATNAFAAQLLPDLEVKPGRAQVLVTEPIPNLKLKGCFHFEEGYYYFRNIDNRLLFGGGRNLAFETETTLEMQTTNLIQDRLENYLSTLILPQTSVKIERRWAGIMGLGNEKKPIVKMVRNRVVAAVRMGGMGVAIGSKVGQLAANLLD